MANPFDKKFGSEFLSAIPTQPGVYRVFDQGAVLIYVGKAKNLRRRLGQYRNAKRCKKHLKMRKIIADAKRIEFEVCASDAQACLLEIDLIQAHRPKWNIAGAFYFLYPLLGIREDQGNTYLCYTMRPEEYPEFRFHGAFRSREVTREAFHSLVELLSFIGHPLSWKKLAPIRKDRFSRLAGFRQLPSRWIVLLESFFEGRSAQAMEELVLALVENAGARRRAKQIQAHLQLIRRFWRHEALPLAKARDRVKDCGYPVTQRQRDGLFIQSKQGRLTSFTRL